jgi:predicted  nucleic acid-binding Zn-ribbon protein
VDEQLQGLIDLQQLDTRIFALEGELRHLPTQIDATQAAVADSRKAVETLKAELDAAKKAIRAKEKDLDVSAAKRAKSEARLYEVKTNKEYSAVLAEIEEIKQEKSRIEEEILALMEVQERSATEIQEREASLKQREVEARREEAKVRARLQEVESDLEIGRGDRQSLVRQLPRDILTSYDRLLRHCNGVAVVQVLPGGICGGCRVALTPQRFQEVRQQSSLHTCESCGRYQYWLPA